MAQGRGQAPPAPPFQSLGVARVHANPAPLQPSLLRLSPRLQSLPLSHLGSPSLKQAAIGNGLKRAKRKLHTKPVQIAVSV